jgi:putative membrane protein
LIFNVVSTNDLYDYISHTILLVAAFFMWWNITCPVPEMERLSSLLKFAYIVGNGVLLTPACALIIFADSVLYTAYIGVPQLFSALTPLGDQQLGGVIMKIIQELVLGTALAYSFRQWYSREKSMEAIDHLDSEENDVVPN